MYRTGRIWHNAAFLTLTPPGAGKRFYATANVIQNIIA